MSVFSDLSISPEKGADLLPLLGVSYASMDMPGIFNKVKDVVGYFGKYDNPRGAVLRILAKKQGMDKLDILWTYVQLQHEKKRAVEDLDKTQFAEDIQKELNLGDLSRDSIRKVKSDGEKHLAKVRKDLEAKRRQDQKSTEDEVKALEKIESNLTKTVAEIVKLEDITNQILKY